MQVSIKWLEDYIDIDLTAEELADRLTMAGIPVERVIRADEGLEKVITGRIDTVTPHPDSDHLQICSLNVGAKENIQIVTGAQNIKAEDIVPVAMVGAHLPNGQKISKGKLRGVPSNGMMCSASELKMDLASLSEGQINGIYVLPEDTKIGVPVKEVLGLDDVVLEFELTANRADCFSVLGLVREIAVLTGKTPRFPEISVEENGAVSADSMLTVAIEAPDLCRRFSARVVENVKIEPSPAWMKTRLEGAGIRAINNVVDVTNFVMLELGQPMHAYDYEQIVGKKLTARRAVAGENLHTLDDSARMAKGEELVIADAEKPAGLAGVMGGMETEVTEATHTVAFEAAVFYGPSVRRTARACGLHSEASGRFERGVDETQTQRALDRACQLLKQISSCTVAKGIIDVYPVKAETKKIPFTAEAINQRLGTSISAEAMKKTLEILGFEIEEAGEVFRAIVPTWRMDCTFMEDLSEEIARIHGFDGILPTALHGKIMQGAESDEQIFIQEMKNILTSLGMTEEVSFSFTSETLLDKLCVPKDSELRQAIPVMNPLTDDYPLVRTTLLTSLMENVARNFSRKNEDLRMFDIAPVFLPKSLPVTELPNEPVKAVGLITGRRSAAHWAAGAESVDFYDLKGIVEALLSRLSISKYAVERGDHFALHPGRTAVFKKGREIIATLGEVHPTVAENFGIKQKLYAFEMDVAVLMKYRAKNFRLEALPKYPAIARDLAIVVDTEVQAGEVEQVIAKSGGNILKKTLLFDVYTGKQVEEGKKSLAFNLYFQSEAKTLTDEEADAAFKGILQAVETKFSAKLRV